MIPIATVAILFPNTVNNLTFKEKFYYMKAALVSKLKLQRFSLHYE